MAVRIAIVEDEKSAARVLEQAIQRYGTENKVSFTIRVWHDPLLFLEEYQAEYDIVYMDIRMPALSGMETARNLRKMDRMVMLIFVTSLAQYALEGYTVGWPLKAALRRSRPSECCRNLLLMSAFELSREPLIRRFEKSLFPIGVRRGHHCAPRIFFPR